jgi:hypothetical protein
MKKLVMMMLMVMSLGMAASASAGNTVKIFNPKVGGVALDWCKTWATDCGQPAADYYCKKKGYKKTVGHRKENNIGYTKILKTGQICNISTCDSFESIKCEKKDPVYKRYNKPKYNGVALDWCYTWANNCGAKPAKEFCKSKGHARGAFNFRKDNNVGHTKLMRTGQECNSPGCDSYKYINCKL